MLRRKKKKIEKQLMENANKKYCNQIIEVRILDKHNCELTIEIDYSKRQYVILPIAELI